MRTYRNAMHATDIGSTITRTPIAVINPATGAVIGEVAKMSTTEVAGKGRALPNPLGRHSGSTVAPRSCAAPVPGWSATRTASSTR